MKPATSYAKYVLAPLSHEGRATVNIKETRYKTFSAYLIEQANIGLIALQYENNENNHKLRKRQKKNKRGAVVDSIIDYDRKHVDLSVYLHVELHGCDKEAGEKEENGLVPRDLYCIPEHIQSILEMNDVDSVVTRQQQQQLRQNTSSMLTFREMRKVLDDYAEKNNLVEKSDHGGEPVVVLNEPLRKALQVKKPSSSDSISDSADRLYWKHLHDTWKSQMDPAFMLEEMPGNRVVRMGRGPPPVVTIEVAPSRGPGRGRTRVRGLEEYGISPVDFASFISHRFGCGTHTKDTTVAPHCTSDKEKKPNNHHANPIATTGSNKRAVLRAVCIQGDLSRELQALLLGGKQHLTNHGGVMNSPYPRLSSKAIEVVLRKKRSKRNRKR